MSAKAEELLVTGAGGQDGSILVSSAINIGHRVHAVYRTREQAERSPSGIEVHVADLAIPGTAAHIVKQTKPSVIFHLAGMTSVGRSWDSPSGTLRDTGVVAVELLEAAWRLKNDGSPVRLVQASSAEIYGESLETPQTEDSPLSPTSPYGVAKVAAHRMVQLFRQRGMHASNAILYNHESRWRGEEFVTRKISRGVAEIKLGIKSEILLGNLESRRDWGYAPDYVDAMIRISAQPSPGDYIVATGATHTVRDFVEAAFLAAGIADWRNHVRVDPSLFRPTDSTALVGDAAKLRSLGWRPTKKFEEIVFEMVQTDLESLRSASSQPESSCQG